MGFVALKQIVALVVLAILVHIPTSDLKKWGRHHLHKRSEDSLGGEDDPAIPILENLARQLPTDYFLDDPFLIQSVDRINKISAYKRPYKVEGKDSDVVYERNANDKDKDVVVLSASEDKISLKTHSTKQTYVVLKRNPKATTPAYYAAYAYLRNATANEQDAVEIGGYSKFIEWDVWEDRTIKKAVRWTTCSSSVLVACGFNSDAFKNLPLAKTPNLQPTSSGGSSGKDEKEVNKTKPAVTKDDAEYEMDNYDFFDDLNIDLVHGRFYGAVSDVSGTVGGGAASISCGMVGAFVGGTCGGGKAKKVIVIKKAPPVYPVQTPYGMPQAAPPPVQAGGPPPAYIPFGTQPPPPGLPPCMSQVTNGLFYPDNRQIPPAMGTMVPFGPNKPFLFQTKDPNTFGPMLPSDRPTPGIYTPTVPGPPVRVHGVMLPVNPASGIFIPDGMGYPSYCQPKFGGAPIHGISIPGQPGSPDLFVPDSDMNNPLRKYDPKVPIPATVTPDQPNKAQMPVKPGQLLNNKMPPQFIPDSLRPVKSTFTDDARALPPITGFIIPGLPGNPDNFLPDDEQMVKNLRPPPTGTMAANQPPGPSRHGLLFPGGPGQDPLFIPDDAGGPVRFTPDNPATPPSDGILTPMNPKTNNDYYPNQPLAKPQTIPGTMYDSAGKKPALPGNLIVNKNAPPYSFLPNGIGTSGTLSPDDGRPPVKGIWAPGMPGTQDEFIPFAEPTGGLPPLVGKFTDDKNPGIPIPIQTGPPNRPGGPPTIKNAPPTQRPPGNMPPARTPPGGGGAGGAGGPSGPPPGRFVHDEPPIGKGGDPWPMNVNPSTPPVLGQPITFTPAPNIPPGTTPRGNAEVPGLSPQHGKITPPATFVPDPPQTTSGYFTPASPPGSPPAPGYVGPPSPPREGEQTKFTPDDPKKSPKQDTPGLLGLPGQPPLPGILHPPPYEGAPCPFTPFGESSFIPDKNPMQPIEGSVAPTKIPNGDPKQEVPFYMDNPLEIPIASEPQRGNLKRPGEPDTSGVLRPPIQQGEPAKFIPDPINSKAAELVPDYSPQNGATGSATLPYNPTDPIPFKPDDRNKVPPGDTKGKLVMPSHNPPEQHGTIHNPPNPNELVTFIPDKPAIFTPSVPPGATPVQGSLEEPKVPGQPMKFYPNDPTQLTQIPTPGTITTPSDPTRAPLTGMLRPDSPPPAYSFQSFPKGQFTPDDTRVPSPGGVEVAQVPGQNPNFYPDFPGGLNGGQSPGILQPGPNLPEQHGILMPCASPPNGPRPFAPFPSGSFYPDSNPMNAIPVSVQPGNGAFDPSKIRGTSPMNPLPMGNVQGTLKSPGKGDQHGTAQPPPVPGGPYAFQPDPPGSKPSTFTPESNPSGPVQGVFNENPPTFTPGNPNALAPQPTRGSIQPNQPPGSPPTTGTLTPGPGQWNWTPDPTADFFPDSNPGNPIGGTSPIPKTPDENSPFYPSNAASMPPGYPKGTLKAPGQADRRGTMEPNPQRTPQPSWIFRVDKPDCSFTPSNGMPTPIPGTTNPPQFPGAPTPFYAQNPAQMPQGGAPGTLQQPGGQPPKQGTMLPPGSPGQPYMFQEQPPSLFYPDKDPFSPVTGSAVRPADTAEPFTFSPQNPAQSFAPGQTPGTVKSPGVPDVHGFLEPGRGTGGKPLFTPDPLGSTFATVFPDRDPSAGIDGTLSPGASPDGPKNFRPTDTVKTNPNGPDHGQLISKTPGSAPEFGTLSPPSSPGGPFQWKPDPPGVTPAWFYPDSRPQQPIRGLYTPSGSEGDGGKFKVNKPNEAPTKDEHGSLKKDFPINSHPEIGTLKPASPPGSPNLFLPDPQGGLQAIFYPDLNKAGPVEGTYFPSTTPGTPGTFKPKNSDITATLPAPGQMCPQAVGNPQSHGVLKPAPYPSMPLMFQPDEKGTNSVPEMEVSLIPHGEEIPSSFEADKQTHADVNIRGSYYKSTVTSNIFVAYTGTTGAFVTNGVGPTDPKAQKMDCQFVPKQGGESQSGAVVTQGVRKTVTTTTTISINITTVTTTQSGVFYPSGATGTGVPGMMAPSAGNPNELSFKPHSASQVGTWKPKIKSGCYMFNKMGELIPFDKEWLRKRQEEYNKPPAMMRSFNFQGELKPDSWDIFIPMDGTYGEGKFSIQGSQIVIHGVLKPDANANPVLNGVFIPDDPMILQNIASSAVGGVPGAFEQDESPAISGVTPKNGIAGTMRSNGGQFSFTFNRPGRTGNLNPGRLAFPGFFIYCVGLVENLQDKGKEIFSNPVQKGRSLLRGRSFGRMEPPPAEGSVPVPTTHIQGRGFGRRPKVDPDQVTSENMQGKEMLEQDFGGYLKRQGVGETITETHTETHTETITETKTETKMMMVTQQQLEAMKEMGLPISVISGRGMGPLSSGDGDGEGGFGGVAAGSTVKHSTSSSSTSGRTIKRGNKTISETREAEHESDDEAIAMDHVTQAPMIEGVVATKAQAKSGEIEGVAYQSHNGANIFIPNEGAPGTLHIEGNKNIQQIDGTLYNGETTESLSFSSPTIMDLIKVIKKAHALRGAFVPKGGSIDGEGGIQLTITLGDGNSSVYAVAFKEGVKGSLRMGAQEADEAKGELSVSVSAAYGKAPTEIPKSPPDIQMPATMPEGSVHGAFYKGAPSDVFVVDFPGTKGTFFPNSGIDPVTGQFFPSVKGGPEMFWADTDGFDSHFPVGREKILVGKFVPDDPNEGSQPPGSPGFFGHLKKNTVPKSYIFKADQPAQTGWISKKSASSSVALGRSAADSDDLAAQFTPDNAADIFEHPGWKTQFEIIVPNVTLKYDDEIYYGYGNCPHKPVTPADLAKITKDEEVVIFYMSLLRTYCLEDQKRNILNLIRLGYLHVKNKLITIPAESKYLKKPKLTVKETERLSAAFELCVFTLTYADEVKKGVTPESVITPEGKRISRSVKYLLDMSILAMKMTRELCHHHSVRLSRNLIITLTTSLTKLQQDIDALANCDRCTFDLEIIHNDSMQLMGMVQFIMHGLSSLEEAERIRPSFETFYKAHKELIHKKVLQLTRQD